VEPGPAFVPDAVSASNTLPASPQTQNFAAYSPRRKVSDGTEGFHGGAVKIPEQGAGATLPPAGNALSEHIAAAASSFREPPIPFHVAVSPARSGSHPDPFAAIDSADSRASISASAGAARVTAASGGVLGQLQVGYRDPDLGYVELRAHSDGGGIHASLSAQTESGTASLSGSLSELAAWMDARHTPVESLSVLTLHGNLAPLERTEQHGNVTGGVGSPGFGGGLGHDTSGQAGNQSQAGHDGRENTPISGHGFVLEAPQPKVSSAPDAGGREVAMGLLGGLGSASGGTISILV